MSFVHPEVFKLKIENQKLREQLERYKRECHDIDDEEDFCLECEGAILRKALEAMKKQLVIAELECERLREENAVK